MTNDGHNGDNVEQGRGEPTLKEVCITPQPKSKCIIYNLFGPRGLFMGLVGFLRAPWGLVEPLVKK